jgi:hypothetical protein
MQKRSRQLDTKNVEEGKYHQKGHVIRVDHEVWDKLKEKANDMEMEFKPSNNQVLRKILGLQFKARKPGGRPTLERPRIARKPGVRPLTK